MRKKEEMSQLILMKKNLEIKRNRPLIAASDSCEVFQTDTLLEISISRGRCTNDAKGTCIMCDYGEAGKKRSISSYLNEMQKAIKNCGDGIQCLMLCTNGSIFDEKQISPQLLEAVVDISAQCAIPHIEFETHYQDVTQEKLILIQKKLPNKKVIIALGLETINQVYQDEIILKGIDLKKFKNILTEIKKYNFQIELNVMLGLPFLSTNEQFIDTCNTIKWVFENQCRPVLFPLNIKPYTLLMEMYRTGYYTPISHWLLLMVLDTLSNEQLGQIIIAWYGNRIEETESDELKQVLPTCCEKCASTIQNFYQNFVSTDSGIERKRYLDAVLTSHVCDCKERVHREIENHNAPGFRVKYHQYLDFLSKS